MRLEAVRRDDAVGERAYFRHHYCVYRLGWDAMGRWSTTKEVSVLQHLQFVVRQIAYVEPFVLFLRRSYDDILPTIAPLVGFITQ